MKKKRMSKNTITMVVKAVGLAHTKKNNYDLFCFIAILELKIKFFQLIK